MLSSIKRELSDLNCDISGKKHLRYLLNDTFTEIKLGA